VWVAPALMSQAKIGSGREDECVSESAWYIVRSVSGVVCRNTKRRSCRSILTTSVMTAASRRGRRKNRTTTTKQRNCRVRASGRWCRATDVDVAATQTSCSPSRPRNGQLWCSRAEEKWTTSVECDKDESTNMKILKVFLSHYWPNNDKCVLSLLSRLSTSAAERRRLQYGARSHRSTSAGGRCRSMGQRRTPDRYTEPAAHILCGQRQ